MRRLAVLSALALLVVGCAKEQTALEVSPNPPSATAGPAEPAPPQAVPEETTMALTVTSPAFEAKADIPAKYTADGDDVSPELSWTAGPEGTVAYALLMDDPDAPVGDWVHWVAWNLAATHLAENAAASPDLGCGAVSGTNSWGRIGWGGPAPPRGTHRYYFRVYALDTRLELAPNKDKRALLAAMEGHVLAQGELMGRYQRPGR